MTNLIEVAEELEFVPKESLIQMAQNPNSRFPSYMVLSEIQRRTQMEKMYNAARMERPQTTVAQELVGEFSQPQGLAGAMTDDLGRLPNNFSDSVAPANSLMQMANGGLTGSDAIRQAETSLGGEPTFSEIAASYNENQRLIREQEAEQRRIEAERIFGGLEKTAAYKPDKDRLPDYYNVLSGDAITQDEQNYPYDKDLKEAISQAETDETNQAVAKYLGILDEEGNVDKLGTGLAFASLIPVVRGTQIAGQVGKKLLGGLPGLYKRLFPRFYQTQKGKFISTTSPQGRFLRKQKVKSGTRPDVYKKKFFSGDMKRANTAGENLMTAIGLGGLGGAVLRQMSKEGQSQMSEEVQKFNTEVLDNGGDGTGGDGTGGGGTGEGGKDKGDDGKKKEGLLGKIDPLDIAKLGGIILGAKGTGDIGQGITALASDVQQRRAAEQERQDVIASREKGDNLKQAQIDQIKLAIESAPISQLTSLYKYTTEALRLAQQSMIPDEEYIGSLQDSLTQLIERLNELQGLTTVENAQEKQDEELLRMFIEET